jgi:hypothetical protein
MNLEPSYEFLSDEAVAPLGPRESVVYSDKREKFISYLRTEGKNPKRDEGYPDSSVPAMARRQHQVFEWVWEDEVTLELTESQANAFVEALNKDEYTKSNGEPYSENSKRKFTDTLKVWFQFRNKQWSPKITFKNNSSTDSSDFFHKSELNSLWMSALDYKSIPSYNNLSSEERDRWKGHIAQELGKKKQEVKPEDWEELNKSWCVPSLIGTTRDAAWRPAMVGRLKTGWYYPDRQLIIIPGEAAIKNDEEWKVKLTDEGATALDRWLKQRANKSKYDGRDEIWLNRKGNPHNSDTLNGLCLIA